MNALAADYFKSFMEYMAVFAKDEDAFSKRGLLSPPRGTMDKLAAGEWRRVAPKLYEMDRLWPREIIGLHAYCTAYAHWFAMNQKAETLKNDTAKAKLYVEFKSYVDQAHAHLKQSARGFGFFLDDSGRMNLNQPLPLQPKPKKAKKQEQK
jgi:phage terminase small subunit